MLIRKEEQRSRNYSGPLSSSLFDPAHLLGAPDLHAALGAPAGRAEEEDGAAVGRRHLAELGLELPVRVPEVDGARPGCGEQRRSRGGRGPAAHALLGLELDVELDGLLEPLAPGLAALARVVAEQLPRDDGGRDGEAGAEADGGGDAGRGRMQQRAHLEEQQLGVRDDEEAERGERREEEDRVDGGHRGGVAAGGSGPGLGSGARRGAVRRPAVLLEGAEELDEAAALGHLARGAGYGNSFATNSDAAGRGELPRREERIRARCVVGAPGSVGERN
jgi:hypothetical protein